MGGGGTLWEGVAAREGRPPWGRGPRFFPLARAMLNCLRRVRGRFAAARSLAPTGRGNPNRGRYPLASWADRN